MLLNVSPASLEMLVVQNCLSLMQHDNMATFLPGAWHVHKDILSPKLQSKPGSCMSVKTKLFKRLQSVGGVDDTSHN
eukprot:1150208-Pelagomonas_calceolata.AAC.2